MSRTKTVRQRLVTAAANFLNPKEEDATLVALERAYKDNPEFGRYVTALTTLSFDRLLKEVQRAASAFSALRIKGRTVAPPPEPVKLGHVTCALCDGGYGTLYALKEDHPAEGLSKGQYVHRSGCKQATLLELKKLKLSRRATNELK